MLQGEKEMSSDRLVNFLYLYNQWTSKYFTRGLLLSVMVIIALIVLVVSVGDESKNRAEMESIISMLINVMMFIVGVGFGIIVLVPMLMNRLQDKV